MAVKERFSSSVSMEAISASRSVRSDSSPSPAVLHLLAQAGGGLAHLLGAGAVVPKGRGADLFFKFGQLGLFGG
jgi:hypothetical protein